MSSTVIPLAKEIDPFELFRLIVFMFAAVVTADPASAEITEENSLGKSAPMDEDSFDSFDHKLFRDAYRIRGEDTFDLNYLYHNKQLNRLVR